MPTPSTENMSMSEVGGGLGVGLVTLIGGLLLHGHFEPVKRVCDSGLGALGQALGSRPSSRVNSLGCSSA
jgi:hypothetical protein